MKVFGSEVVRNSGKILSANAAAQLVALLVYPLLTRIYTPQDFGLYNLWLSIGTVLVLLSTADLQYAVVLPEKDRQGAAVFHAGFLILAGVTLVTALSAFLSPWIAALFKQPELARFYPLLPLFVFFSGLWSLLNYWFTRQKKFGNIALYQITQNVGTFGFKYGFGAASAAGGLFWGTLAGWFVSLGISITAAFKNIKQHLFSVERNEVMQVYGRYKKFPLYSMPKNLINSISAGLPFLLLTPVFGTAPLGFLGVALTFSFKPVTMFVGSVYQVLYQRINEKVNRRESVMRVFRTFVWRSLAAAAVAALAVYFILPPLFGWFLGEEWQTTGQYIRLLLPWIIMVFPAGCMGFIPDIFQKQAPLLVLEMVYLVLRIAALAAGMALHNIELAIVLYSLTGALVLGAQLCLYARFIAGYEKTRA